MVVTDRFHCSTISSIGISRFSCRHANIKYFSLNISPNKCIINRPILLSPFLSTPNLTCLPGRQITPRAPFDVLVMPCECPGLQRPLDKPSCGRGRWLPWRHAYQPGVGVTSLFSPFRYFPIFQNDQNTGYLYDTTYIFARCHRSWSAATHSKYERDRKYLTYTFAKYKFPVAAKWTSGALVTPTPGPDHMHHMDGGQGYIMACWH